jgi:hypothetical protein
MFRIASGTRPLARFGALPLSVGLLIGASAAAPPAVLGVSATYSISGIETAATATQGTFEGTATGSSGDYAAWKAVVKHTRLTTTASITGGYATLWTSDVVTITGRFSSGSVTQTDGFSGCTNQHYDVDGRLSHVTRSDRSGVGSGHFQATLTHYRTSILGRCVVYWATVSGTVSLSF